MGVTATISWGAFVAGLGVGAVVFGFLGLIIGSLAANAARRAGTLPGRPTGFEAGDYAATIAADVEIEGSDEWLNNELRP